MLVCLLHFGRSRAGEGLVAQVDARSAELQVLSWTMAADLEALAWSPAAPTTFLASAEDGIVAAFDARAGAGSDALYRLAAHDQPTCALSFCPGVPGLLCTASTDGTVRLNGLTFPHDQCAQLQKPRLAHAACQEADAAESCNNKVMQSSTCAASSMKD